MPASNGSNNTGNATKAQKGQLARIITHAGGVQTSQHASQQTTSEAAHGVAADTGVRLRVAAYCRYSSHNQDSGYSLEAQHEAVEREAAALATWDIRYYDEPATSAYTEDLSKRPVFLRMLADARDGLIDIVVVHRLDRFSRNVGITAQVVPALLASGVQFISLTERLDATTPAGLMMLHTIGAVAQYESGHKAAGIRNGQRQRAKIGLHNSRVAYGYRATSAKTPAEPDVALDGTENSNTSATWHGLMRFVRLALSGLPDYAIADTLNAEGYRLDGERLFSRATIAIMRHNVYYRPFTPGDDRGTITYAGIEYRGQHPAAMSWDEWQQVQGMARNRRWGWNTPGLQRHYDASGLPFTAEFRGLAVCASCGSRLYVWRNAGNLRQGKHSVYERYVCSAHKRETVCIHDRQWARVEDVRLAWLGWVREHLTLPADWQQVMVTRLQERHNAPDDDEATPTPALRRMERLRWIEKRDRAIEVYTDGLKDRAWMELRVAEADAALLALERLERPQEVERVRLMDAGNVLMDIAEMWQEGLTEERIALASHIIAPGGLALDLHGKSHRGGNRWHPYEAGVTPPSCAITRVELQPAFRDLLAMLQRQTSGVA